MESIKESFKNFFKKKKIDDTKPSQLWYIIFVDREERRWWDILTKKHFRHVYGACYQFHSKSFVLIEFKLTDIDLMVFDEEEFNIVMNVAREQKGLIVSYVADHKGMFEFVLPLMSCVSVMEHFMGVKWLSFTPYGLYRNLLKNGGKVILDYRGD